MFNSKADIECRVQELLRRAKTDIERNSRCLHAAQLFYKCQDYESARKYIQMYLTVRSESSSGHKLLAHCLEELNHKNKALLSYKKSLELEPNQHELVLKICQLLNDENIEFDPAFAQIWCDRACALFPHEPAVFALQQKLLLSDSSKTPNDLEELLLNKLKAREDVSDRIKLLKLQLENNRVDVAYTQIVEIEPKQLHQDNLSWYQCIDKVCQAYYKKYANKCDWEFFTYWLVALDRLCSLSLSDAHSIAANNADIVDFLYKYDQYICVASKKFDKPVPVFREFIKHVSAQVAFYLALLLIKQAKKENSLWKETKKSIAPLLMIATSEPINPSGSWYPQNPNHLRLVNHWIDQGKCRFLQAGTILHALKEDSEKTFIEKLNHRCTPDWRNKFFQKTFMSVSDLNVSTSHFVTSQLFSFIPQRIPSKDMLHPTLFQKNFEAYYSNSLHHLVWLGLLCLKQVDSVVKCEITAGLQTSFFSNLHLTMSNLDNSGVETLNQLDADSFLYATIIRAGLVIEDQKTNGFSSIDKLQILPADLTPPLCTPEQATWWSNACNVSSTGARGVSSNSKMPEIRVSLQRGIETVRGEGLPLHIHIGIARTFAARARDINSDEEGEACERRAMFLWSSALPVLERLGGKEPVNKLESRNSLFDCATKPLKSSDVNLLLSEARLLVGSHYMKTLQFEKAIEYLRHVQNAQSNYNLAMIYQKLADKLMGDIPHENITTDLRCRYSALMMKAKECLNNASDLMKGVLYHPLRDDVKKKIVEVGSVLSRIDTENGDRGDEYFADGWPGSDSGSSETDPIQIKVSTPIQRQKLKLGGTPKVSSALRTQEISFSADLTELISVQHQNHQVKIQQVIELVKGIGDKVDMNLQEGKSLREVVMELKGKVQSIEAEVKDIKKEVKRPDFYNMLDDDDYGEEMLQYPNPYPAQQAQQHQQQRNLVSNMVQYPPALPQYFSPGRVDQMYTNNVGFFNQTAPAVGLEGTPLPEYLRSPAAAQLMGPKVGMQPGFGPTMPPMFNMTPTGYGAAALTGMPQPKPVSSQPLGGDMSLRGPTNVVITTSDTLPTGTPPAQPTLSVTIPPHHRLGDYTPPQPYQFEPSAPSLPEQSTQPGSGDAAKSPQSKVEDKDVLFQGLCEFIQFMDKRWVEKGKFIIQISKDKPSNRTLMSMTLETGLKSRIAHYFTDDMELKVLEENSCGFWVAKEFPELARQPEKFAARFKSPQDYLKFKNTFESEVARLKKPGDDSAVLSSTTGPGGFPSFSSGQNKFTFTSPAVSTVQSKPASPFSVISGSKLNAGTTNSPSPAEPPKITAGGFTFQSPPKFSVTEKTQQEMTKDSGDLKKLDRPFANFSFVKTEDRNEKPNPFGNTSNFSFLSGNSPSFAQLAKESLANAANESPDKSGGGEEVDEEFESTASFKPVIPLPELVDVKSGEEDDAVLFEERAKLYRFCKDTKQWKERGVGKVKILKHKTTGVVRFVMRREQVLKVCLNHRVAKDLKISPSPMSDRAYVWGCRDYSEDDKGTLEMFTLKFKLREQALAFKEMCDKAIQELDSASPQSSPQKNDATAATPPPLSSLVKHSSGSWECSVCYIRNNSSDDKCKACQTKNPSAPEQAASPLKTNFSFKVSTSYENSENLTPLSALVKHKEGSWECKGCFLRNESTQTICPACNTLRPGAAVTSEKPTATSAPTFTFGMPATTTSVTQVDSTTGSSKPSTPLVFGFTPSSVTPVPSTFGADSGLPLTAASTLFEVNNTPQKHESDKRVTFGVDTTPSSEPAKQGVFSFGKGGEFQKSTFQFTLTKSLTSPVSPVKRESISENETSDHENSTDGDHIYFQPVIPLPDKIEVKTGEENETILYSHRSKLFRYDDNSKEWKERGLGDIKILKHNVTGKTRLLMRREPIMKICLNHYLTTDIKMVPMGDRGWFWFAKDYSDKEIVLEKLAAKFKSPEIAAEFKAAADKVLAETDQSPSSSHNSSAVEETSTNGDDDVIIVDELKVSPELREKALALKLPPNFFASLDKPPCSGCIGCEKDDETIDCAQVKAPAGNPPPSQPKSIFGGGASIFGSSQKDESSTAPPSFATFTFGQNPSDGGNKNSTNSKPSLFSGKSFSSPLFGGLSTSFGAASDTPRQKNSMFGSCVGNPSLFAATFVQSPPSQEKTLSEPTGFLSKGNLQSFSTLADASPGFNPGPKTDFKWEGAGTVLFSSVPLRPTAATTTTTTVAPPRQQDETEGGDDEGDETVTEENDAYFEPVIPLPDVIDVKTGEEDEDIVFGERSQLYRFDQASKTWKERGVGNLKILKHKILPNKFRLLLRREQVYKIVCNHLITGDLSLKPLASSTRAYSWVAMNLSDGEPQPIKEHLSARFKTQEIAEKFLEVIEKIVNDIKCSQGT